MLYRPMRRQINRAAQHNAIALLQQLMTFRSHAANFRQAPKQNCTRKGCNLGSVCMHRISGANPASGRISQLAFARDALERFVLVLDAVLKIIAIRGQQPYHFIGTARSGTHDIAGCQFHNFPDPKFMQLIHLSEYAT